MDLLSDFFGRMLFFFNEMAIYLLFGFIVAGVLHLLFPESFIRKHLGGGTILATIKASILGVPIPLCSCGVIPAGISLYRQGASKGSTVSFLISTPQTGVDSIFATYSFLGPIYAFFRPAAAFISGIVGGMITNAVEKVKHEVPQASDTKSCLVCKVDLLGEPHYHTFREKIGAFARYAFVELPADIAVWLAVGIAVAAAITIAVPDGFFQDLLLPFLNGKLGSRFLTEIVMMLIMMIVAIPIYVCATASIPIAVALIIKGLSPGAAFVFLMAGPATNSATITLIWRVLGARTLATYLFSIALTALLSGLSLNVILSAAGVDVSKVASEGAHDMPHIIHIIGALALGIVFLNIFYKKTRDLFTRPEEKPVSEGKEAIILKVKGMTCEHCVRNVKRAIEGVCKPDSIGINLETGRVEIIGGPCDVGKIKQAIEELGYKVMD